jgi:uncharacterized protein YyaL (SSP411 family)
MAWLDWGSAALAMAKERDCPVLLYLAAPGCEGIFAGAPSVVQSLVEERFVSIKVDPYRRPDIAEQFFTGGWPALVLLTASGQPFALAVDIAPRNLELFLLRNLAYYAKDRPLIKEKIARSKAVPDTAFALIAGQVYRQIQASFDQVNGGFGQSVKFPEIEVLRFLLIYAQYYNEPEARQIAIQSIDALLDSPMVDGLTGGLEIFSYTPDWRTPVRHKDAIDQAGLLQLLLALEETSQKPYTVAALTLLDYIGKHLFNLEVGAFQGRQVYIDGKGWWTDPGIYADRNALLISAFVKAALVLEDKQAEDLARLATTFLVQNGIDSSGAVFHTYGCTEVTGSGCAQVKGLLTDQVLVGKALLDMYQLDGAPVLKRQAEKVIDYMEKTLFDPDRIAFYTGPPLMHLDPQTERGFPYRDGMLPAGNPLVAELFLRLKKLDLAGAILAGKRLSNQADRAHASYARVMLRFNQARQASL